MPEKIIPPWMPGSKVVEETKVKEKRDFVAFARAGGTATQRNKRLRAQGYEVKSASMLAAERIEAPKDPGVRGNPNPESLTSRRVARFTDDYISDKMRDRAIQFCHEYIRDFSVLNAWIRIGGNPDTPTPANEMIRWPFVQQYLAKMAEELNAQDIATEGEIMMGLKREANSFGDGTTQAARVQAWDKLSKIKAMQKKVKEHVHTHRGGVMLIPAQGAGTSMDDWESNTVEGQAQLKTDVTK